MIFIFNIIFSILSLVLFFRAPDDYSYSFCLLINLLFIAQNIIYFIGRQNKSLVGFQFIFMIAFYFTNFVYPVSYFPTNPTFSVFEYSFNNNIISKATSIAFLAYSFYMLGLSIIERKSVLVIETQNDIDYDSIAKFAFKLTIVSFALYVLTGGLAAMKSLYSGEGDVQVGISPYFYMLLFCSASILATFVFNIKSNSKQFLYFSALVTLMLLLVLTGTRTIPLALGLILLISYNNNRKKIPNSVFLSLIVVGALFLTFIMFARSSSISNANYTKNAMDNIQLNSFWDIGSDLIINNRNLYTLIDFADNNGHTFGLNMLGGLFSTIPFLQGLFCSTFGVPVYIISSDTFNTFLEFGPDFTWGLGTNVVADIYLSFGILGVLVFFTSLGWIIGKSERLSGNNVYWNVIYVLFVSNSVYLVRSGFFQNSRTFAWSLLIIYLYNLSQSVKSDDRLVT
jgi:oligosaccharide repeat unit polymerase